MVLTAPTPLSAVHQRIRESAQCTAAAGCYQLSFRAMSTQCRVHFRTLRPSEALEFEREVLSWVAWFEATYSRFVEDSIISRINRAAGREWVELDPETDRILELCGDMCRFTRGVFDPTSLPLMRLWNWKADRPAIPEEADIREAMSLVGAGCALAWSVCSRIVSPTRTFTNTNARCSTPCSMPTGPTD